MSCKLREYFASDTPLTEPITRMLTKVGVFLPHFNRYPPTQLQYFSVAITALVLYEYLLTLSDEVSR